MEDATMLEDMLAGICEKEEEFFYNVMMHSAFNVLSPFEVDKDADFPRKDEFGGVLMKFIGGGAAYFKIIQEMPSEEEVRYYYEIGKYLQAEFGEYVEVCILCTPDIEIRDIDVVFDEFCAPDFLSIRKNDAVETMDMLIEKLEKGKDFTAENHILRILVPFMSRKDEDEFEEKYSKFMDLYEKSNIELPSSQELIKANIWFCRWFTDDRGYVFS